MAMRDEAIRDVYMQIRRSNTLEALKENNFSLALTAKALGVKTGSMQSLIKSCGLAELYLASNHPGRGNPHRKP